MGRFSRHSLQRLGRALGEHGTSMMSALNYLADFSTTRGHGACEKIGDPLRAGMNPLLVRRGGRAIKKMSRSLRRSLGRGGRSQGIVQDYPPKHAVENDHPGRSDKETSQHFFDVAATPPHEEGTPATRNPHVFKKDVRQVCCCP